MSGKSSKALRRAVAATGLGESPPLQNRKTGVVFRGPGLRAAVQKIKRRGVSAKLVSSYVAGRAA